MLMVGEPATPVRDMLERVGLVVFRLVGILMRAAPIGAFGAMAFTIGKYGVGSLANLASLLATFYLTSALFVIVVLGIAARLAGFSIFKLIRYLKAELLLVLGTSLTVMSGLRFVRRSAKEGRDVIICTDGQTRGDDLATLRLHGRLAPVLSSWVRLAGGRVGR